MGNCRIFSQTIYLSIPNNADSAFHSHRTCVPLLGRGNDGETSSFVTIFAVLLLVSMSLCCFVTNSFAVAGCMVGISSSDA